MPFSSLFNSPTNKMGAEGILVINSATSSPETQEFPDLSPVSEAMETPSSEFDADLISVADVITSEHKVLNLDSILKAPVFPDWYFNFRVNFLGASEVRKAYCLLPFGQFKARFHGSPEAISKVVNGTDKQFHLGFKALLKELLLDQDNRFFSRAFVESNFYDIVEKHYNGNGTVGEPRDIKFVRGTSIYPVDLTYTTHSRPAHNKVQTTVVHTTGQHTLAFRHLGDATIRNTTSSMKRTKDTTLVTQTKGKSVTLGSFTVRERTSRSETFMKD